MTATTRRLLGVLGALLVLALALAFFVRHQIRKSFPVTGANIEVRGLSGPVEVQRDVYGVPLISGGSTEDVLFGLGFAHAQDRFWQMDLARRTAAGRLAEIFGPEAVPFDRMFRIVGLRRIAEKMEQNLSAETRASLQAYSEGVNAYRAQAGGRWPLECDLLGYEPEEWSVQHSLLVVRLIAWELNLSWWVDMTLGAVAERVGLSLALDVFPRYPADVPPAVAVSPAQGFRPPAGFLAAARAYREFTGRPAGWGGSNAVAVAASRSATGFALLANDTHLPLTIPSFWYEARLRDRRGTVAGFSVPGVPGIVIGRNDSIAWGVTNLMADEADYYVERIDTADGMRALFDGRWYQMEELHEEIAVRGDTAQPVTIRITRHGPIVSDIGPVVRKSIPPYVVSMRWTGADPDDPVGAFLALNHAGSWKEFSEALRTFGTPGQNFVYCDVRGNIGYRAGVRIPIRGSRSSTLPLPGWDPGAEWKGFVPFRAQPAVFNPPTGFVASANNKVAGEAYPYHISDLWEPPSRITRLRELLGGDQIFTVADLQRMQSDRFSFHAMEVLPFVFRACRDSSLGIPEEERMLEYFRNWTFEYGTEDIATTLFQAFIVCLYGNIFRDEMGPELYHDYVLMPGLPIRVVTRLLVEGTSPWFDDTGTAAEETADMIIRRSLREAVEDLRDRLGPDMKQWRWGELHTVTLRHPLGLRKPLDRVFNRGPYPFPGASTALVSGEYAITEPFAVTVGPTFRMVVDMGDRKALRAVLPPGQSGHAFHDHYDDQVELWLNGGYRIVRSGGAEEGNTRLVLVPER